MSEWTLYPVAPYWAIAILVLGLLAMLAITARQSWIAPIRRRVLILLRGSVVLVLALMLVRPGCIQTVSQPQRQTVAIMADVSRSMQLPHAAGGPTRWERLNQLLDETESQWKELKEKYDVKAFLYERDLQPLELTAEGLVLPDVPGGGQTDHGNALDALATQLRGDRVAAIFLMGDGVQNIEFPPVEMPRALRELEQLQAPLWAVPFGRKGQEDESVDISITNFADQFAVFAKNELLLQASVRARGFANQAIPVQLLLVDREGNEQLVGTTTLTPTQPIEEMLVEFRYSPQDAGEYRLTVRAEPQPREVVDRNNELTSFLTVYEGGLRVLYVEGRLDLEQRYLRRSLAMSQDLEVDFLWIDHRDRSRWPLNLSEQFQNPEYDVIILGDLDARALHVPAGTTGCLGVLADQVEQGKGLILLGGKHSFGGGRYQTTPLAGVLPIKMHDYEAQDFDAPLNSALHLDRELTLRPQGAHFLTRLSSDDLAADWRNVPPLLGANRFVEIKPDAQVLLESERGEPVLVIGNPGGRVACFAGDSTWRWWTLGQSEVHRRFWRQMVLWAAGLDSLGRDALSVEMARRRFSQGSPITATVGARSAAGEPLENARMEGAVVDPTGVRTTFSVPATGSLRTLELPPELVTVPGLYQLQLEAFNENSSIGSRQVDFVVFDDDREKAIATADPDQLGRIAAATKEAGGDLVPPERVSQRMTELLERPPQFETLVPKRWRLGDAFSDSAILLFVMTVLLGTEWWLRRRWGLT